MAKGKQRTRGRNIFKVVRPFLAVLTGAFYIVPFGLASAVWQLLDAFPGLIGLGLRYALAKRLAGQLGENVFFGRGVEVKEWQNIRFGSNVSIHKDCYIDASGGLVIGSDVSIAHNSSILTFEHSWDDELVPIRSNPIRFSAVTIEDDVWIGCGCRILAGVIIRSRVVVAAGAVVTSEVASNSLVGGVPHRLIKRI